MEKMKSLSNFIQRAAMHAAPSDESDEKICFAKSEMTSTMEEESQEGTSSEEASSQRISARRRTIGGIEQPTITAWDAGWNVSNAIQGMFVLGLPYAVLHGGYIGIFLIVAAAIVCNYTGNILIDCLYHYEDGHKRRIYASYADVAVACWGKYLGGHLVNVAQLIELLMTCVLYIVVSGNLMTSSFPHAPINETGWSVIASLFLFPCIFLRHLRAVSRFSMGCSIAQLVVLAVTMIYCLSRIGSWAWKELKFSVDSREFPVSIGVIVFSYTSQIFLPTLEGSMEERSQFKVMLFWSYVASCVTKTIFAVFCFLTWSDRTKDVVTDNLPPGLRVAMNTTLVVKALLSYPLPYYQSLELIEDSFFTNATGGWGTFLGEKRHTYSNLSEENAPILHTTSLIKDDATSSLVGVDEKEGRLSKKSIVTTIDVDDDQMNSGCPSCYSAEGDLQIWALALRAALVLGTLLLGVFIPHFALLMGLTGSLTGTSLAFLLPCAFHVQIKWNELTKKQIAIDITIFLVGIICAITGIYNSTIGLYDAYQANLVGTNSSLPLDNSSISNEPAWFPEFPKPMEDFPAFPIQIPASKLKPNILQNYFLPGYDVINTSSRVKNEV